MTDELNEKEKLEGTFTLHLKVPFGIIKKLSNHSCRDELFDQARTSTYNFIRLEMLS